MKLLCTGGAGFIGHHFVEAVLKNTDWDILILDKLTYAANGLDRLRNIDAFDDKRVKIFTADFTKPLSVGLIQEFGDVNYIVHIGAETHVDNSIANPEPFVMSNVVGTMHLLNYAKLLDNLQWFVYFSTDEIFGPAPKGIKYKEWDRYNSTNPYAATKAAGEELCLAYANTYQLPLFITHTMNAFGERQHPEKFIPKIIKSILDNKVISIHADGARVKAGSRYYIHCRNIASAILFLLDQAEPREKYNIVGEKEIDNLTLAQKIAEIIGKPLNYELVDYHSSRPGHDLRYALDGSRMKELGWKLPKTFYQSLEKTIKWTLEHKEWL